MPKIKVTIENDAGVERELKLPAKYEVCPRCEGEGTHLHPDIGDHAYSAEEFNESFDDEEAAEYFKPGGRYDVTCYECKGKRVVLVIDRDQMTKPAHLKLLKRIDDLERANAEVEAMHAAERRMGA